MRARTRHEIDAPPPPHVGRGHAVPGTPQLQRHHPASNPPVSGEKGSAYHPTHHQKRLCLYRGSAGHATTANEKRVSSSKSSTRASTRPSRSSRSSQASAADVHHPAGAAALLKRKQKHTGTGKTKYHGHIRQLVPTSRPGVGFVLHSLVFPHSLSRTALLTPRGQPGPSTQKYAISSQA